MKKIFILLISLALLGSVSAEIEMLTCSRTKEISAKIKEVEKAWYQEQGESSGKNSWCKQGNFLKINTPEVFEAELELFSSKINDKIFSDNVNNSNVLAEEGTVYMREHRLCLEEICHMMWSYCNQGKDYFTESSERKWCKETAGNFFEIGKVMTKTAVIDNQQRKSRGSVEEKFRAIGIRMQQYFKPNLISFIEEFRRFTGKVTAFIINPLQ